VFCHIAEILHAESFSKSEYSMDQNDIHE
jgi:hypothetical protein